MSYLILIRGPSGIGKTTIARRIADLLDAEYVSVDDILKEHKLDVIEKGSVPLDNFLKANSLALGFARLNLEQGSKVVIDGYFYYREQISHLLSNLGFDVYAFDLRAPLSVCLERDADRVTPSGELSTRSIYNLVSRFSYGKPIQTSNKSHHDVVKEILECLPI